MLPYGMPMIAMAPFPTDTLAPPALAAVLYSRVLKLKDLAARLDCRLEGDGEIEVSRITGLEHARPGDVAFLANPRYTAAMRETQASAVILGEDAPAAPCASLRTPEPYVAFARAVAIFFPSAPPEPGIDERTAIASDVHFGAGVSVGPFVSIGRGTRVGERTIVHPSTTLGLGVTIGCDCLIGAHVSIRDGCVVGDRVILHDGVVVGSDGFGFAKRKDGSYLKIPQVSIVVIEDDVELGANTTIDRPAIGETRIKAGAKIDNLVQIAHGVTVGRRVMLAAQVGIAGSTTIGDDVILAGQVGVAGHLDVGRGTMATAQTGIPNSVPDGSFISGYPAIPNRDWLKASAVFRRLPELKKAVAELERRLAELQERLPNPNS
jgi:UDP-3-O-[3-hydroxymyristoyl] glucosamine N-acyltransferase